MRTSRKTPSLPNAMGEPSQRAVGNPGVSPGDVQTPSFPNVAVGNPVPNCKSPYPCCGACLPTAPTDANLCKEVLASIASARFRAQAEEAVLPGILLKPRASARFGPTRSGPERPSKELS